MKAFIIVIFIVVLIIAVFSNVILGVNGFGPIREHDVTINSKHVDISKSDSGTASHYMVSTSSGTFEVDNGWILGVWNADEIYGSLKDGKRYHITTKGNKIANFFMQEYPYILRAEEIK